jgi:prepilin-type N-terminal cleavage/methylation domain-containing protein
MRLLKQSLPKPKPNNGFTLVEVLVGTTLMLLFAGAGMQAMVVATVFKVQAQEASEASTWIQEDLEEVKFEADRLDFNAALNNYDPDTATCSATESTDGYAARLEENLPAEPTNQSSELGNRSYTLTRTAEVVDAAPFNTLGLTYTVTVAGSEDDEGVITTIYTEVIPNAAFACL